MTLLSYLFMKSEIKKENHHTPFKFFSKKRKTFMKNDAVSRACVMGNEEYIPILHVSSLYV